MSNYQTQPLPPPPPPPVRRSSTPEDKRLRWLFAATGLVVGLVIMAIATPSQPTTIEATAPTVTKTVTQPGPTVTQTVEVPGEETTVTVKAAPPKPEVAFGEGDYVVGEDIKAGRYKTAEPVADFCYWGIYRGGSNHSDIIQNDTVVGGIPRVTLKAGQEFSSNGCGEWVKAG